MKESPNAAKAWNDYLEMGSGRSFDKLLERYRACPEGAPTIHRTQIKRWSLAHGWQSRLDAIAREQEAAIRREGIANKQNRVDALNRREQLMWQVIEERAADREHAEAPGGATGLLTRQWKQVGFGKGAQLVSEFAVDSALLKEMREHEKQAAQEMGQWTERQELTGKDGTALAVKVLRGVSLEDL